jgi:hypothetical protein
LALGEICNAEGRIRNIILEKSYKFTEKILRIILPLCGLGEDAKSRRGIALPRRDGGLRPPYAIKGGRGFGIKKITCVKSVEKFLLIKKALKKRGKTSIKS